ncbi:ADP-ribosyltransferase [Streptomyces sp. NPDC058665]|uniref:ADP-ribosyltransferase n=1 Tax=Streptomyces sp. NPDC058665 TaxID=3346586 RepID=UPI0036666E78
MLYSQGLMFRADTPAQRWELPRALAATRVLLYLMFALTLLGGIGVLNSLLELGSHITPALTLAALYAMAPGVGAVILARRLWTGGKVVWMALIALQAWLLVGSVVNLYAGSARGVTQLLLPGALLALVSVGASRTWFELPAEQRAVRPRWTRERLRGAVPSIPHMIGWRRNRGQSTVEYAGMVGVVALIIGALLLTGVGPQIANGLQTAVCNILGGDCESDSVAGGGGESGGGSNGGGSNGGGDNGGSGSDGGGSDGGSDGGGSDGGGSDGGGDNGGSDGGGSDGGSDNGGGSDGGGSDGGSDNGGGSNGGGSDGGGSDGGSDGGGSDGGGSDGGGDNGGSDSGGSSGGGSNGGGSNGGGSSGGGSDGGGDNGGSDSGGSSGGGSSGGGSDGGGSDGGSDSGGSDGGSDSGGGSDGGGSNGGSDSGGSSGGGSNGGGSNGGGSNGGGSSGGGSNGGGSSGGGSNGGSDSGGSDNGGSDSGGSDGGSDSGGSDGGSDSGGSSGGVECNPVMAPWGIMQSCTETGTGGSDSGGGSSSGGNDKDKDKDDDDKDKDDDDKDKDKDDDKVECNPTGAGSQWGLTGCTEKDDKDKDDKDKDDDKDEDEDEDEDDEKEDCRDTNVAYFGPVTTGAAGDGRYTLASAGTRTPVAYRGSGSVLLAAPGDSSPADLAAALSASSMAGVDTFQDVEDRLSMAIGLSDPPPRPIKDDPEEKPKPKPKPPHLRGCPVKTPMNVLDDIPDYGSVDRKTWAEKVEEEAKKHKLTEDFTKEDALIVADYTGSWAEDANKYLRGHPVPGSRANSVPKFIEKMDTALEHLPPVEGTFYRGTFMPDELLEKYANGEEVEMPEYLSTSSDPAKADRAAENAKANGRKGENVLMEITTDNGRNIDPLSRYRGRESEVLIPRGGKFVKTGETTKIIGGKEYKVIQVKQVD